jgi:hypothetical protein
MTTWIPLRYFLPRTVFTVRSQISYAVTYDGFGGHLEPRTDTELTVGTVPDRRYRCTTTCESDSGDSGGLGVEITPEGLIRTIGAASRSASGQISRLSGGTGRSSWGPDRAEEDADRAARISWTAPGDLRVAFDRANPRIAALIEDLSARAEQFLAGMRMADGLAEVEKFGQVLTVVERELAAADRMRREWIADQGFTHSQGTWHVDVEQMVHRNEDVPLPELPARTVPTEDAARELAERFGILLVAYAPERVAPPEIPDSGAGRLDRVEEILLRRPRPVTVAVYRRTPEVLRAPDDPEPDWVRDPALGGEFDVVDAASDLETVVPRTSGPGRRGIWMELSADGSLRAVGGSPGPVATATVIEETGSGELSTSARDRLAVASAATEAAGVQRALLRASDELTRLAVIHAQDGEPAPMEHDLPLGWSRPGQA